MRRTARSVTGDSPERPYGFTLVELIVVMAIFGILASIAVPRLGNSITIYRADAAARRIVADLALAQRRARTASATVRVEFSPDLQTYTLRGVVDLDDSRNSDYRVVLGAEPYHARVRSVDFGGQTQVEFDGYGVPRAAGTVVLEVGAQQRTVRLDASAGRASVE